MTYRDIQADVRGRIARGEWPGGAMLPTEIELAARYGCARATVNRALRELAEEGILDRRRKSGTRVSALPTRQARFDISVIRREIEARGAVYRYALVTRAEMAAPDWLRARMGLGEGAQVLHLVCMHYADGQPFQHEDRWINLQALPQARAEAFDRQGPNEWLLAAIPFSELEVGFSAVAADADLARHLGCTPGEPLFQMDRSTWFEGQPVTFVRMCHPRGYRMASRS